jgi:hypothetical protein
MPVLEQGKVGKDTDVNNNNNNNNNNETIDHIISACPILTKEQYIKRHNRVSAQYTSTYARKEEYN